MWILVSAPPTAGVTILDLWFAAELPSDWLFSAPGGGPLTASNSRRSVGWREACAAIGRPTLRAHDLRHTAYGIRRLL